MTENFKNFLTYQFDVAPESYGERLDRWLTIKLKDFSRSRIKELIEQKLVVERAGIDLNPAFKIKAGQQFIIYIPPPTAAVPIPQKIPLEIIFEDQYLLIVNKPAGLTVHPAPGNPDHTLVNALLAHCGDSLSGIGGVKRPGIVHRLDKDTSGLMVVAKDDYTHQQLSHAFANRIIQRSYLALIWGVIQPKEGRIIGAIGRSPTQRTKMAVVSKGGKIAITNYERVEVIHQFASLVKCRLETGRTHQIRVHLSYKGHPIIGDPIYGSLTNNRRNFLSKEALSYLSTFRRQALHAFSIGFIHPHHKKTLYWEQPMPKDMEELLQYLKISSPA